MSVYVARSRLRCDDGGVTETNVELARRGYAAALRGDLHAIGELLDVSASSSMSSTLATRSS
jgi:hypothetical protein